MAVSDFTVKVSGTVAYDDNSHGSFEATAIWRTNLGGVVAQHNQADSQFHFSQLYADEALNVDTTLDILPGPTPPSGEVTLTPPAASPDRTVTSFVMEVSGLVSEDDNTVSSFVAQWVNGALDLFPNETVPAWLSLTSGATPGTRPLLVQIFEALAGSGNAAISV
jgi:hypothetical protein